MAYVDSDSTLKYDQLLQALVNSKLGAKALSLEEQRKRGLIAAALDTDAADGDQAVDSGGGSGSGSGAAVNPAVDIEFSNPVAEDSADDGKAEREDKI